MNRFCLIASVFCSVWLILGGCTRETAELSVEEEGRQISFSLSVQNASVPRTKMTETIVQTSNPVVFRGIDQFYVIPFSVSAPIDENDERNGENWRLPQQGLPANTFGDDAQAGSFIGLVSNNNSHLYPLVFIKKGTKSALVYGKAPDSSGEDGETEKVFKHRNGSLIPSGLQDSKKPSGISFALEPIVSGTSSSNEVGTWRNNVLLNYLNGIMNTKVTSGSTSWQLRDTAKYNNHPGLTAAFREFTENGKVFSGSSDVIGYKLTKLYAAVAYYAEDAARSPGYYQGSFNYVYNLAKAVCNAILETSKSESNRRVTVTTSGGKTTIALKNQAPASYGVPAGTVNVQWRRKADPLSSSFGSPDTETSSGVASPTSYCYPPSLWYRANSALLTSNDEDVVLQYNSGNLSWKSIYTQYPYTQVTSESKAAALKDSLQYAVATLKLNIGKRSNNPKDWKGNNVNINNKNYPLTGVLVAGQKDADYAFTPVGSTSYTIYDSEVNDVASNGAVTPRAYISRSENSKPVYVLTMQTDSNADIHFALEFKNASTSSFFGIHGNTIYPGCHFYLLGSLEYAKAQQPSGASLESVFVQDYMTTVNVTISSLAAAYATLPDLSDPKIELGVDVQTSWDLSTPETVEIR